MSGISWYIYLDESGRFVSDVSEPSLIGGLIFEQSGEDDHAQRIDEGIRFLAQGEPGRIDCRRYPQQYHSTQEQENPAAAKEFRAFAQWAFTGQGGNALPARLFAQRAVIPVMMIWTQEDRGAAMTQRLLDEDTMEIRYREMLSALFLQIILACPPGADLHFFIPTREAHVCGERSRDFLQFGASQVAQDAFRVNDPETIRKLLADALVRSGRTDAQIAQLTVRSIDYGIDWQSPQRQRDEARRQGRWEDAERFEHLRVRRRDERQAMAGYYLADLICDSLRQDCREAGYKEMDLPAMARRFGAIFGREPLFRMYGDACRLYTGALDMARADDVYGLLRCRVLLRSGEIPYAQLWLPDIEQLGRLTDERVRYLDDCLFADFYRCGEYAAAMAHYEELLRWLEACGAGEWPGSYDVRGRLMCCHQHRGEVNEAAQLYDLCMNAPSVTLNAKLRLHNQYCQTYADMFEFGKALERAQLQIGILRGQIAQAEQAAALLGSAAECIGERTMLARCLSTKGQMLAFLGNDGEARSCFEEALALFGSDAGNCAITLIHLLQMLAARADGEAFALASRLGDAAFGTEAGTAPLLRGAQDLDSPQTWRRWMAAARESAEASGGGAFQLAVLLKLLYRYVTYRTPAWRAQPGGTAALNAMRAAVKGMLCARQGTDGSGGVKRGMRTHPYEMIYRYAALLLIWLDDASVQAEVQALMTEMERLGAVCGSMIEVLCRAGLLRCMIAQGRGAGKLRAARNALRDALRACRREWGQKEDSAVHLLLKRLEEAGDDDKKVCSLLTYVYD